MRSFIITALCLTLFHTCYARVAHLAEKDAEAEPKREKLAAVKNYFDKLLGRDLRPRQDNGTCYEDMYYNFVSGLDPDWCQLYMEYPNITETVDYTPTRSAT